ncbi:glutamate--cysteine ligase [Aquabacter spiritensis]|uniref:Glutamate--cysteine ligase n=1 Tax=Aquabacter spiritensis TaxID=933073 RepID=A0A4R3LSK1_9HYPH|nr:glutamate--cysteine ligase [Aquabacter spiritensis]TCT03470.1 glutamate--cysteine ligase [Aquabacter spiritensis]
MARDTLDATPISSRDELVAWLEEGNKPEEMFRIGTEHEKIPFTLGRHEPVPYDGNKGIRALLEGMATACGWEPILEGTTLIGLSDPRGGGAISLEPGGQFELSGAPLASIHETCSEINTHLSTLRQVADPLGIGFLGIGMSPKWSRSETPVMPKGRYRIMAAYMPKVGSLGLDMMFRTCTVQVNLDFSSEADMVRKLRASLALQPIATALFANSPFSEGKPNGFLSFRSEIWRDTDADRSGMLPFAFEPGMGFERYVDYALDVPMYFVKRGDAYVDVAGSSFRDLLAGRHPALLGETATLSDWVNHLSTIFPEVRLKRFLEMRGADAGPWAELCALPAFWVGLLYDRESLQGALDLVAGWTQAQRQTLRDEVPRLGLGARIAGRSVLEVARDAVALSRAGLARRRRLDSQGRDETRFLVPIEEVLASGRAPAEVLLDRYAGPWNRSVEPVFKELAY